MKPAVKGLAIAVLLMAVAAVSINAVAAATQSQIQAQTGDCDGDRLMAHSRLRLMDNSTCGCYNDCSGDHLRLMAQNCTDAGGSGIMQRDRDRTCILP